MRSYEYPDPLKHTPNINYESTTFIYSPRINYTRNKMYDDEKVPTRYALHICGHTLKVHNKKHMLKSSFIFF